ncbi:MAG: hypothetical protein JNM91_11490 [Flavobacteriales bacterium]|nr:hypothetical protein [Flavobacteriales bacterium]
MYALRSTAAWDHLIDRFDLTERQTEDGTSESRPLLYRKLAERVHVWNRDRGYMELSVKDEDRERALQMTNALYGWLTAHLETEVKQDAQRRLDLYAELIARIDRSANGHERSLLATAQRLNELLGTSPLDRSGNEQLYTMQQGLSNAASQMLAATQDLMRAQKQYESALVVLEGDPISGLRKITEAQVDTLTVPWLSFAVRAILWSALVLGIMVLVTVYRHRHGQDLRDFLVELDQPVVARSGYPGHEL